MFGIILNTILVVVIEIFSIFNLYREFTEFGCRISVVIVLILIALFGIALAGVTINEYKENGSK